MITVTNPETAAIANFAASRQKIDRLFLLEKITLKDIEDLSPLEREYISETCTGRLDRLKGDERDRFLDKIDLIMPARTKSNIWDYNHSLISNAISKFINEYGTMPSQNALADETGLSRQTVAKHIKECNRHAGFTTEMEQLKIMAPSILATVFKSARKGDMRAARLYLEMVGVVNKQQNNMVVNEQNNYIQINNTILSQEKLKRLSAEQLNQIENIVTNGEYTMIPAG